MTRPVVLVLDGDPLYLDLLSLRLNQAQLDAITTTCPSKARSAIEYCHPQVLILNPTIKGGLELLDRVRTDDWPIAVIGLTNSADHRDRLKAACVETVLDRDLDFELLLAAVWAYIDTEGISQENRIFVISQEEKTIRLLRFILSQWGHDVVAASDTHEAAEFAATDPGISVALLDAQMVRARGNELLRTLQRCREDVPVVLLTGPEDYDVACRAGRLGAFSTLTTPINADALHAVIRSAFRHRDELTKAWWQRLLA